MRLKEDFHHTLIIERSEFICYLHDNAWTKIRPGIHQQIRRLHLTPLIIVMHTSPERIMSCSAPMTMGNRPAPPAFRCWKR